MLKPKYLEIVASVRYWEDAIVNGAEDKDGDLIPFRSGDTWNPIIDIENKCLVDWPIGIEATIHYKVCDAGQYYLLDENKKRTHHWGGFYVPADNICSGNGYGDYIIMKICPDGKIEDYDAGEFPAEDWEEIK